MKLFGLSSLLGCVFFRIRLDIPGVIACSTFQVTFFCFFEEIFSAEMIQALPPVLCHFHQFCNILCGGWGDSLLSSSKLACVASVLVRLSARSMHFSLFWPRENWGGRKKVLFPSISVALASIFAQPKSEKRLQRAESPTETLATQATSKHILKYSFFSTIFPVASITME